MFSQASRLLISRIHLPWRQFFQGRNLVVTNTLGGGVLMALGDCLQQSREMHMEAGRARNWKRTGEKRVGNGKRTWRHPLAFLFYASQTGRGLEFEFDCIRDYNTFFSLLQDSFKVEPEVFQMIPRSEMIKPVKPSTSKSLSIWHWWKVIGKLLVNSLQTFIFLLKGSMFLVGCSMGYIEHYWYQWLARMYVGRSMKAVAKKVLVDQLICAPGIGLWYFMGKNDFFLQSMSFFSSFLQTHISRGRIASMSALSGFCWPVNNMEASQPTGRLETSISKMSFLCCGPVDLFWVLPIWQYYILTWKRIDHIDIQLRWHAGAVVSTTISQQEEVVGPKPKFYLNISNIFNWVPTWVFLSGGSTYDWSFICNAENVQGKVGALNLCMI